MTEKKAREEDKMNKEKKSTRREAALKIGLSSAHSFTLQCSSAFSFALLCSALLPHLFRLIAHFMGNWQQMKEVTSFPDRFSP